MKTLVELLEMKEEAVAEEAVRFLTEHGYTIVHSEDGYIFGHHPTSSESKLMLVSHMDTVRDEKKDIDIIKIHHIIRNKNGILGGDDRCGVYVNMNLITKLEKKPYVLFTHAEESGGKGVRKFCTDKVLDEFIENVHLFVEYDRKGLNDMVVYHEPENIKQLDPFLALGYEKAFGSYSDVATLSAEYQVAHVNLSVGYFNQHTVNEHIYVPIVEDAITLGKALFKNFVKYFPTQVKIKPIKVYTYKGGGYQSSFFRDLGESEDDRDDFDMDIMYGGSYWRGNKNNRSKGERGGTFRRCYICGIFKDPSKEMDWSPKDGAWVCNCCTGTVGCDYSLYYNYNHPHKCAICKMYHKTKNVNWDKDLFGYVCKGCNIKRAQKEEKKPALKAIEGGKSSAVTTKYQCEMCNAMTPTKYIFNDDVTTQLDVGGVCESCVEIGIQGGWWKRSEVVGYMKEGVIIPIKIEDNNDFVGEA